MISLTFQDDSDDSDFMDAKPSKKGKERVLDSDSSDFESAKIQEVGSGEEKDEFDISSDNEGLASRIVPKEKPKKAPTKKLAKSSDLMMGGAGASKAPPGPAKKKLPVPKKAAEKHKKSESQSENDKPAKKKAKKKVIGSDSEEDLFADAEPAVPRTKQGNRLGQ